MLQTVLGLMVVSLAIASYVRIREDSRFTARVIAIHLVAVVSYLCACAIAMHAILLLNDGPLLQDLPLLASLGGFFIIVFGGVAILARYLKKILDQEQKDREE